jgi:hypothetical protein
MIEHSISIIPFFQLLSSTFFFYHFIIFRSISISMFTLFNDPFYLDAPTSSFECYLDALDQRFLSILSDDATELLGLEAPESSQTDSTSGSSATSPSPSPAQAQAQAPDSTIHPSATDAHPSTDMASTVSVDASKSDQNSAKQSSHKPAILSR